MADLKEAAVYAFKERLNKMDTTELEANREKSDALAEQQDVVSVD
jgi:hypothetical protein